MTSNGTLSAPQLAQLNLLDFWMNGVITNLVVILGLIGNLLTIVILRKRTMRSSTNFYLLALAAWDSIVLLCTAFLIGIHALPAMSYYRTHAYAYIVSYLYPVALIAQTATIWLTVSFTVERYIAVCHPLKAASMCTISRAKIVIIGVSLGSTLYNIPRWFDFRPNTVFNPATNASEVLLERTEFSKNDIYRQIYFSWLYVPIMCIVPLLVLSILNFFLIVAVRRSRRQRKTMNVRQSREINVTTMLVTIVVVFIFCQVPALVYNIAFAINDMYVNSDFTFMVFSHCRNFLVCLNSAVNFILYCAIGQNFRKTFLQTFCSYARKIPAKGVSEVQPQHYSLVATTHGTKLVHNKALLALNGRVNSDSYLHHINGHHKRLLREASDYWRPSSETLHENRQAINGIQSVPKDTRNAFYQPVDFVQQNGSTLGKRECVLDSNGVQAPL